MPFHKAHAIFLFLGFFLHCFVLSFEAGLHLSLAELIQNSNTFTRRSAFSPFKLAQTNRGTGCQLCRTSTSCLSRLLCYSRLSPPTHLPPSILASLTAPQMPTPQRTMAMARSTRIESTSRPPSTPDSLAGTVIATVTPSPIALDATHAGAARRSSAPLERDHPPVRPMKEKSQSVDMNSVRCVWWSFSDRHGNEVMCFVAKL